MKIIDEFAMFQYGINDKILGSSITKKEFFISPSSYNNEFYEIDIYITDQKNKIKITLNKSNSNQTQFAINSKYFEYSQILKYSKTLNLKTIKNIYYPDEIQASIPNKNSQYPNVSLILKNDENQTYLIIYSTKRAKSAISAGEDMFGNDIIYIYRILKISEFQIFT